VIARTSAKGDVVVEPTLAQRLAEELVVDMVRRNIDIVGLLQLELDMIASLGGKPTDDRGHVTPQAVIASVLVEQAFERIEQEWREGRVAAAEEDCVCCAIERQAAERRSPRKGGGS
jgi:hypothetical protein